MNNKHRKALIRRCCSAHKLAIEEGRFRNIDVICIIWDVLKTDIIFYLYVHFIQT